MKFGKILGWIGQPMDGMGLMVLFDLETGETVNVPCETAPTFRALSEAFPDGRINGKYIKYEVDDLGIMTGFTIEGDENEDE